MADINRRTGEPIRKSRVFIHTTAEEKQALFKLAEEEGFPSLSKFMRERGLHGGATPTAGTNLQWEAVSAVHRIANEVQTIAAQLSNGRQPDEELLLVAMQIQEVAEETLNELKAAKDAA